MHCADAERCELDDFETLFGERSPKPLRRSVASRQDHGDRARFDAWQREPQHRRRRFVEPLHVVDGQHETTCLSEPAERTEKPEGNDALVNGRTTGFREGECRLERPALRARQLGQDLVDDTSDQIRDAGERESGLDFGRAARQNQCTACLRSFDRREPERGLADPRLAHDNRRGERAGARIKEIDEHCKLVLSTGEVPNARCHASVPPTGFEPVLPA